MVTGRVTGAILAGEPSIRMGNRIFSVADVLEVNEPQDAQPRPRIRAQDFAPPGVPEPWL